MVAEELLLEGRCEAVQDYEAHEHQQSVGARPLVVLRRDLSCEEELRHSRSNYDGGYPVDDHVSLLGYQDAPQHDRDHLAALAKHLHCEGYVLQSLILHDAGRNCSPGDEDIFPQRSRTAQLLGHHKCHNKCEDNSKEAVVQDEEGRASKVLPVVRICHYSLLPEPVQEQHAHDPAPVGDAAGAIWKLCRWAGPVILHEAYRRCGIGSGTRA
mmetsp:Transcript_105095/g.279654  ORF Transcript_105095/g.279654 Transcript_105095/m.279654 type:complete len:212 (-) Transcript_105095:32-667(-)